MDQKNSIDVRKPNNIDLYVGKRIKQLRDNKKISQKKMAELIGITFQQLQKYESGLNRVVASRLYDFSRALCVPISAFFEGINESIKISEQQTNFSDYQENHVFAEEPDFIDYNLENTIESRILTQAYYKIKSKDKDKADEVLKYILDIANSETAISKKENKNDK